MSTSRVTTPTVGLSSAVLVCGGGERQTLRIVAEHADIWYSFSDSDMSQHTIGVPGH